MTQLPREPPQNQLLSFDSRNRNLMNISMQLASNKPRRNQRQRILNKSFDLSNISRQHELYGQTQTSNVTTSVTNSRANILQDTTNLTFDLEQFKTINQTHRYGDLKELMPKSTSLQAQFRRNQQRRNVRTALTSANITPNASIIDLKINNSHQRP